MIIEAIEITKTFVFLIFFQGGMFQIIDRLSEAIGKENIDLNSPVVSVSQFNDRCLVKTECGKEFKCKFVVLAIPPHLICEYKVDNSTVIILITIIL